MLRMFKSCLPRTEAYLPTLLNEHAVVFLPENPRKWEIIYRSVKMDEETARRYRMTVEEGFMGGGGGDARSLYVRLKGFLRNNYEEKFGLKAVVEEVERLRFGSFFFLSALFFDFRAYSFAYNNFSIELRGGDRWYLRHTIERKKEFSTHSQILKDYQKNRKKIRLRNTVDYGDNSEYLFFLLAIGVGCHCP